MKKIFFSIALVTFGVSGFAQAKLSSVSTNGVPSIKWVTDSVVQLGSIVLNKATTVVFEFENTGGAPVIISRVEPTCGCTSVDYSKEPVLPKQKGFVKTTYNSASVGTFSKSIMVYANTSDFKKQLIIKGEVISSNK